MPDPHRAGARPARQVRPLRGLRPVRIPYRQRQVSHPAWIPHRLRRAPRTAGIVCRRQAARDLPRPSAPPTRALEIEPAPVVEDERAALRVSGPGDDRARGERPDPRFEVREPRPPGSRPVPARDLVQRDAGVSVPGPRAGKRRRKPQLRPAAAIEPRDQRREVPVDVGEMALREQIVQHRRSNRGPRVHVPGAAPRRTSRRRTARRLRHGPLLRKQSSSASRHSALGRSKYTPRLMPAAGSMPRTKR